MVEPLKRRGTRALLVLANAAGDAEGEHLKKQDYSANCLLDKSGIVAFRTGRTGVARTADRMRHIKTYNGNRRPGNACLAGPKPAKKSRKKRLHKRQSALYKSRHEHPTPHYFTRRAGCTRPGELAA